MVVLTTGFPKITLRLGFMCWTLEWQAWSKLAQEWFILELGLFIIYVIVIMQMSKSYGVMTIPIEILKEKCVTLGNCV